MAGHARQFLAESDGLTMMVDIAPDPASCDEFLLTGQLVGYRSVASIQAVRSGAELGLAIVDQFGQFELRASDAGLIELIVSDADREYIVAVHL